MLIILIDTFKYVNLLIDAICYTVLMKRVAGLISSTRYRGIIGALIISNLVSVVLLLMRFAASDNLRYWFLIWNLILGWLPLLFAFLLIAQLRKDRWLSIISVGFTMLWLGFLPNSFYLVSDIIHIHETGEVNILYDIVMFMSFIFNGFVSGLLSIYLIHKALLKRESAAVSHAIIAGVFLLASFAIYLGRVLRWNTWDALVNPAGVLFDVSEQVINPVSNPQSFVTTVTFFALLGSVYVVVWQLVLAIRNSKT
jgi:uncharacterized membrane protein